MMPHRALARFFPLAALFVVVFIVFGVMGGVQAQIIGANAVSSTNAEQLSTLIGVPVEGVTHIEWSPAPDRSLLAVATIFGVYLYDIDAIIAGASLPTLMGNDDSPAQDLSFSPDGALLAAASGSIVRVYDVNANTELFTLQGTSPIVFSPTGVNLLYTNGNEVRVYDVALRSERAVLIGHTDRINDVVFSADGGLIATASQDTTLRYWDAESGEQVGFSRSRRNPIISLSVSPNGALIAMGTRSGVIRLLNLAVTTERTYTPEGYRDDISSVDFNADGSLLLYTVGNSVHLLDINTNTEPVIFTDHTNIVLQAEFSRNGSMIASVGMDDTLYVYGL